MQGGYESMENVTFTDKMYLKMKQKDIITNIFNDLKYKFDLENPDFYYLLKYIYYINYKQINNKSIFMSIVSMLLSKRKLFELMSVYMNPRSKCKKILTRLFHKLLYNTMMFEYYHIDNVIKIQKYTRKMIYERITKHYEKPSENNADPFTFDNIDEMPKCQIFTYQDKTGHIYKFNAIELDYYISYFDNWNPYTKEPFEEKDLRHLSLFLKYNGLIRKTPQDIQWFTNLHALTAASQEMERAGFYNNVSWLQSLTFNDVINVIVLFKDISYEMDHDFFSNEIFYNEYQYEFSKEIVRLFSDSENNFFLCCNLIKALSVYSQDFYTNMPSWLSYYQNIVGDHNTEFLTLIYYFNIENVHNTDGFAR
jgi:hypothetical protein